MDNQHKNYDNKGCLIEPKDVVKILYCENGRVVEVDKLYSVYTTGRGWIDVTVGENEWETMFPREVQVVKKHFEPTGCLPSYDQEYSVTPNNVSFSWDELGIAFTKSEGGCITVVPKEAFTDKPCMKEDAVVRKYEQVIHEEYSPQGVTEDIEYVDGQVMHYGDYEIDNVVVDEDNLKEYDDSSKQIVIDFIEGLKENK